MDYLSVTQTAYFSAALVTTLLTFILAKQAIQHRWIWPLTLGFGAQVFWGISTALSYGAENPSTLFSFLVEASRYFCWLATLGLLLSERSGLQQWPTPTKLAFTFSAIACSTLFLLSLNHTISPRYLSGAYALTALSLVILTEQALRNLGDIRLIKIIGLSLICQFIFEAYLYGQIALGNALGVGIWQTRAAIMLAIALIASCAALLFSDHKNNIRLSVTRPVVFYASTALIALGVLIILGMGSVYVQTLNGFIGSYLFSLVTVLALLSLIALMISKRLKANAEVFISKHFFNLKYDYREQWFKTIQTTSGLAPGDDAYYDNILRFVCQTFKSSSGALWIADGNVLRLGATRQFESLPYQVSSNEVFVEQMLEHGWSFAPQGQFGEVARNNESLPEWAMKENIWLLAPMVCQKKLIGMIAISQPPQSPNVTFEDRDLMSNVTDQIASQILLHLQEEVISSNKQMETYNRLSAFIMHDLNNVIAQLALITRNAERHKNNPAFIDDMVKTVGNSVNRMLDLVQKFKPQHSEVREPLSALALCQSLIQECSDKQPLPLLDSQHDFKISADPNKMRLAIKNLIRNAQEATQSDGRVTLNLECDPEAREGRLLITDTGEGMSAEFISNELFKPFSTTKIDNGVGIGAHLTRSYLEHLGAQLQVESEVGAGTTFIVRFHTENTHE